MPMVACGLQAACMLVLNLADVKIQLDKIMDVKAFFQTKRTYKCTIQEDFIAPAPTAWS